MVWDAARITPETWASIRQFYRHVEERNADFRPLLRLVEHVIAQAYSASIASARSGTALLVAHGAQPDWVNDAIRVDVALSGAIRFTFPRKGLAKVATYECDGAGIVGAFESILSKARWIEP